MPTTPIIFVVSTGRTGTTFLADALEELGVDAHHEPGPLALQRASHARASGRLDHDRALTLVRETRPQLFDGPDRPYLEASLHLYGLVDVLLEEVPGAHVVQVVRDPRTYVRSAMIWGVHRVDGRPRNVRPYRRASPAHQRPWNPFVRARWLFTRQFERVCWTWTTMNRTIRTQGQGHDRFRIVTFEDLFSDTRGPEVLGGIAEQAGLSPSEDELHALVSRRVNPSSRKEGRDHPSRRTDYPRWEEWSERQRRLLQHHCAVEAARYGYDLDTPVF